MDRRVGLLLNFNESVLKKGIRRFVLDTKNNSLTQGMARMTLFLFSHLFFFSASFYAPLFFSALIFFLQN